jgi:hypothetical protein
MPSLGLNLQNCKLPKPFLIIKLETLGISSIHMLMMETQEEKLG